MSDKQFQKKVLEQFDAMNKQLEDVKKEIKKNTDRLDAAPARAEVERLLLCRLNALNDASKEVEDKNPWRTELQALAGEFAGERDALRARVAAQEEAIQACRAELQESQRALFAVQNQAVAADAKGIALLSASQGDAAIEALGAMVMHSMTAQVGALREEFSAQLEKLEALCKEAAAPMADEVGSHRRLEVVETGLELLAAELQKQDTRIGCALDSDAAGRHSSSTVGAAAVAGTVAVSAAEFDALRLSVQEQADSAVEFFRNQLQGVADVVCHRMEEALAALEAEFCTKQDLQVLATSLLQQKQPSLQESRTPRQKPSPQASPVRKQEVGPFVTPPARGEPFVTPPAGTLCHTPARQATLRQAPCWKRLDTPDLLRELGVTPPRPLPQVPVAWRVPRPSPPRSHRRVRDGAEAADTFPQDAPGARHDRAARTEGLSGFAGGAGTEDGGFLLKRRRAMSGIRNSDIAPPSSSSIDFGSLMPLPTY